MLYIREAIAVEGRYDKNTLSQVVDTLILETGGFQIFKDPEKMALLDRAARRRGLIVLTDSDGAGFVIRNRIKGVIPAQYLKHGYIPDICGKERRKRQPGKEGKLGVEGMSPRVLEDVLRRREPHFWRKAPGRSGPARPSPRGICSPPACPGERGAPRSGRPSSNALSCRSICPLTPCWPSSTAVTAGRSRLPF